MKLLLSIIITIYIIIINHFILTLNIPILNKHLVRYGGYYIILLNIIYILSLIFIWI